MSEKGKKVFVWKTLRIRMWISNLLISGPAGNAVKRLPRQYKWPTGHGSGALFPICGPDSQIQEALLPLTGRDKDFLSHLYARAWLLYSWSRQLPLTTISHTSYSPLLLCTDYLPIPPNMLTRLTDDVQLCGWREVTGQIRSIFILRGPHQNILP